MNRLDVPCDWSKNGSPRRHLLVNWGEGNRCQVDPIEVKMNSQKTLFWAFDKKGYTPPQQKPWQKGGQLFADGDVDVPRQIDSKSKSTAFDVLPGLPTIQFFFLFSRVYT